ncbi:MAG: rRNA pseudouridine synthase [Victivallales bacterium]|nr:rRNA pseudouridine synthase [Victivallales bacterium]
MEDTFHEEGAMRLAKYLANAGIAARRKCEELIAEGRVTVDGAVVRTPVCNVVPGKSVVCFEGREVVLSQFLYYALNKPCGYTCTTSDPHAEHVIYELLPENLRHLNYVGRLDRDTEGLLILTNDGELVQGITHPSHEVEKRYIADCRGYLSNEAGMAMVDGLYDDGEFLQAKHVRELRSSENGTMLEVILTEGRKREVRRLCQAVGLRVMRLARVAVGNIALGKLPSGEFRPLTAEELKGLRRLVFGK